MAWRAEQFRLNGGFNEEDPQFTLPPGALVFSRNYECLPGGGYRRVPGYERFDGQTPHPSDAVYVNLAFTAGGPRAIAYGDVVVGVTSGATGIVIGVSALEDGTDWDTLDAAGTLGLTLESGVFVLGETLTIGAVDAAIASGAQTAKTIGDADYDQFLAAARNYARVPILPVPGSTDIANGGVIGGFVLDSEVYVFATEVVIVSPGPPDVVMTIEVKLYKATPSGWQVVALTDYLRYTGGTAEILEGDTITGASSGATATVRRVSIGAGNFSGPTFASGRLAVSDVVGTFVDGEDLEILSVAIAVASGTVEASTFSGGENRFQCVVTNFFGASNLRRAYGCDGVNRAFEFDGNIFMFIETGMDVDTPQHIEAHRNHLFLGFPGGSVQNSGTGTPTIWSPRLGASEIGIGDDITGLKSNGNDTLAITGAKTIQILQGTSNLDWNLRSISDEIGSVAYTMQEAGGQTLFLDRAGINIVIPAPAPNQDFSTQSISRNVRKTLERMAPQAVGSLHAVKTSQYRLFFDDKSALVATFYGTKLMGWTGLVYPHQFSCWFSGSIDGVETMFGGTRDGYVMQLDTGSSFDGTNIESILQLPYSYHGSPDRDKRFHKLTLEVDTPRAIDLRIGIDYDYGAGGQTAGFSAHTSPTGGIWDVSLWESFFWDSPVLSSPEINIDGVAKNIGFTFYNNSDIADPFTLSAAMLQYTYYGIRR